MLSAHPDDESIGAGRLLSAWRRSGGRAQAVTATAGEACFDHVTDPPGGSRRRPPGRVARRPGRARRRGRGDVRAARRRAGGGRGRPRARGRRQRARRSGRPTTSCCSPRTRTTRTPTTAPSAGRRPRSAPGWGPGLALPGVDDLLVGARRRPRRPASSRWTSTPPTTGRGRPRCGASPPSCEPQRAGLGRRRAARHARPPRPAAAGPAPRGDPVSGPPDFDAKYRADPDPWDVGGSPYEQRKRGVVLAGLRRPRYAGAWDPACGTGHLTADLAGRCDRVVASDASATAARLAAERCAGLAVDVSHRALPEAPDDAAFTPDLVHAERGLLLPLRRRAGGDRRGRRRPGRRRRRARRRALGRRPGRRLAERARGADRARRPAPRPRLDGSGSTTRTRASCSTPSPAARRDVGTAWRSRGSRVIMQR